MVREMGLVTTQFRCARIPSSLLTASRTDPTSLGALLEEIQSVVVLFQQSCVSPISMSNAVLSLLVLHSRARRSQRCGSRSPRNCIAPAEAREDEGRESSRRRTQSRIRPARASVSGVESAASTHERRPRGPIYVDVCPLRQNLTISSFAGLGV